MVGKSGKRTRLTLQEKLEALRMLESGSFPSAVRRFDVENDDDVRDAVVADGGGGGERADTDARTAAPKSTTVTESSGTREDVEPHQRLRVESLKKGATGREGVLLN